MRTLVVTVVHTPLDARIFQRQIRTLLAAGHTVTYVAPFTSTRTPPPVGDGLRTVDVPRASGRRRLTALRAARAQLRSLGADHDVVLLHDPELLLAVATGRRHLPPVVLDVHEDTAAALIDRPWVPATLRGPLRAAIRITERWAERHLHLLLAERSYQDRFLRPHPFVPNVPPLALATPPPPGDRRVVYLGRLARSRGALQMLALAERVAGEFEFEFIGQADDDVQGALDRAVAAGQVRWEGFLPNVQALPRVEGALAGLSLIEPQPNHAGSLQTKVLEYLSRRVPVLSSDLPVTGTFIREHAVGHAIPYGDLDAAVAALRQLRDEPHARIAAADRGFQLVQEELNWDRAGRTFVETLESIATGAT